MPTTQATGSISNSSQEITPPRQYTLLQTACATVTSSYAGGFPSYFFGLRKIRKQTNDVMPTFKKDGFYGFFKESFRGVNPFILALGPACFLQQVSYEYVKSNASTPYENIAGATLAGATGGISLTVYPNVVIRQLQTKESPMLAFKNLWKQSPRLMFIGFTPTLIRESLFGGSYLYFSVLASDYSSKQLGEWSRLPAQLLTGLTASVLTQPVDTLATVMQKKQYKNLRQGMMHLWHLGPATTQVDKETKQPVTTHAYNKKGSLKPFFHGTKERALFFTSGMMLIGAAYRKTLECFDEPSKMKPRL